MAATLAGFDPNDPRFQAVPFPSVLDAELDEIAKSRILRGCKRTVPEGSMSGDKTKILGAGQSYGRADSSRLVGLSFSGGGIRSATFNLGILQGFAEKGFLSEIDYLSTVSGGGYIGAWLAGCIRNLPRQGTEPALARVFSPDLDIPSHSKEPTVVSGLREYSNYLTPRLGLLGADAGTMVAIYLRNLFLNLMITVGSLMAILMVPSIVFFLTYGSVYFYSERFSVYPLAVLAVLLLFAVITISFNLQTCVPTYVSRYGWLSTGTGVQVAVALPVLAAVWIATVWIVPFILYSEPTLWFWIKAGTLANSAGWLVGLVVSLAIYSSMRKDPDGSSVYWTAYRLLMRIVAIVVSGAVGGVLLFGVHNLVLYLLIYTPGRLDSWQISMWIPPALLGVLLISFTLQIGIANIAYSEQNREWFARLGAYFLMYAAGWVLFFLIAIPNLTVLLKNTYAAASAVLTWLGLSVAGVLAGKSDKTGKPGATGVREILAKFAPFTFVLGLLVLISLGVQEAHHIAGRLYPNYPLILTAFVSVLVGVAFLSACVDINLFSMNLFYRNRLVRCYLGASHPQRRPQKFTNFDPTDDFPVAELVTTEGYAGPYPIFNTALNLVGGDRLAWQERKAESFVFTPIYSGYDLAAERRGGSVAEDLSNFASAAYRRTSHYAYPGKGVFAGTAMAISGAAASPNMGYHSSPAVTFLLTIFNVRLGWWMGNPRHKKTWYKSGPKASLLYLVFELLGMTDDNRGYVYLSDGGHFENLGLYELVRRRCTMIIACDAGQDGAVRFDDLGSAIQKCRTDFGVEISDLSLDDLVRIGDQAHSKGYYAKGLIDYGEGVTGTLLYVKPALTGGIRESVDLMNYQRRHKEFPHDSTTDQWFSESQFESYRKLGQTIGAMIFEDEKTAETIRSIWPEFKNTDQKA